MMKNTHKRGFTLIELLVVIAIIGILASVVLASLNTARDKGNEAKIAAQISGARAAAEIYYANNTNSYGTIDNSCTTANTLFRDQLAGGVDAGSGMDQYAATANYPTGTTLTCDASGTAYAIMATFTSGGTTKYWCADSTGASIVGATTAPTITADSDCD